MAAVESGLKRSHCFGEYEKANIKRNCNNFGSYTAYTQKIVEKSNQDSADREAMLKARFAYIISKSCKELGKPDTVKLEAEKRNRDREAARLQLAKLEQTVQVDNGFGAVREFEAVTGCSVSALGYAEYPHYVYRSSGSKRRMKTPWEKLGLVINCCRQW